MSEKRCPNCGHVNAEWRMACEICKVPLHLSPEQARAYGITFSDQHPQLVAAVVALAIIGVAVGLAGVVSVMLGGPVLLGTPGWTVWWMACLVTGCTLFILEGVGLDWLPQWIRTTLVLGAALAMGLSLLYALTHREGRELLFSNELFLSILFSVVGWYLSRLKLYH